MDLLLFLFLLLLVLGADARYAVSVHVRFVVEYFASKEVGMVTSASCSQENNFALFKEFSKKQIGFGCLDLRRLSEEKSLERLTSKFSKLGVLLDLSCPRSMDLLKRSYTPEVSDPLKFLTEAYEDRKNEKRLIEINEEVNSEFIRNLKNSPKPKTRERESKFLSNETEVGEMLKMKLWLDNQVALAVPVSFRGYHLLKVYAFYKPTSESRPTVEEIAQVREDGLLQMGRERKRKNLGNGILRAASAVFQPESFTTIDDLATREVDVWSKMSYPHVRLLAEDLHFRIVVRFFDDYGWQKNGTFGHLMGILQRKQADLSAAGLLMRADRFGVVDFLECPFRLQTGILFREPSLSSVSNIFLLPFSKSIWISVGVAIVLTIVALRCRVLAGKALVPPDENVADFLDIANYIVGAVCQQGFAAAPTSLSARTSVLVILLTSLALFTSYSACIVALLQSSSSAISTIGDLTRSELEVGIQSNFPLYKVIIQEAEHPVLKEFFQRKVLLKGEKAFCDRREGIERMRTGMFAFEVELTAGYKLISETYGEREKCGIREIDPIQKPFICISVRKSSPYKQVFTERLIWQQEAGLFDRSWKLWVDQKPKCEVGKIGFMSVGLTEFRPALQIFVWGVTAALFVFSLELLRKRRKKKKQKIRPQVLLAAGRKPRF